VDSRYGIGAQASWSMASIAARIFLSCRCGHRELHAQLDRGAEHGPAVESAVGAHRHLPDGTGVTDTADRLGQETLRSPGPHPADPTRSRLNSTIPVLAQVANCGW
jgi:hypothetical protein